MRKVEKIIYSGTLPESFFSIPRQVYATHPFKIDENMATVHELFLTEYADKEIVVYTDHESIRLTGIFDPGKDDACFGFWETVNDEGLNNEAFTMLYEDALARGCKKITGPMNFNTFNAYRLRKGKIPAWNQFDKEPVNPLYYEDLLKTLGFDEIYAYESRMIHIEHIPEVYKDKKMLLDGISKLPYAIVPLNEQVWRQHEDDIYALVLNVFSQNPAFRVIGKTAFLKMYNSAYARGLCPHTSVLFFDRATGKPVAMSFCHPNYAALQLPAGTLPDFGRDYDKLPQKVLLAKTIGVHPAYRQQGLMNYLGAYGMLSFQKYYNEILFCLMRAGNHSLQFTNGLPFESANYALYQKSI